MAATPTVSVIMAAHDAEAFLTPAVESILAQTLRDLELVVVDDGSRDGTGALLESYSDTRLTVLRNDEQLGLAASLNRALDAASGRYIARLDADDVALPDRLARQLDRCRGGEVGIVGSPILEIDADSRPGALHTMPVSPRAVRWAALFSSPFYHPTVLLDGELLERHELRYDTRYPESEDYDLWQRLLEVTDGANVERPLVLYRVHPAQATQRRRPLQRDLQREIALRALARVAPTLADDRELAWRLGAGEPLADAELERAADAFEAVLSAFERTHGRDTEVRGAAARTLARSAATARGAVSATLARRALRLDPALPIGVASRRARRAEQQRRARGEATRWLSALRRRREGEPIRVAVVSPEPAPYRAPLFDRIADRPEVELSVVYAAETLAGRTWRVEPRHPSVFLRGVRVPGAAAALHHDYVVSPGIASALRRLRPDVVVVSGWSTFACQAAIAWCRARGVPYVLQVESHDLGPRSGWRRAVKGAVVPRIVGGAAAVLVAGTLTRASMLERGADPHTLGVFAITVDVEEFGRRADALAGERDSLRERLGLSAEDVVVLSVARLAPEKALDTLLRAVAATGEERLVAVVAGDGPERDALAALARELGVRLVLAGDVDWERIVELYVAADVFALLSEREPWGVVVNEAAACGLPLVLSERVGAAHDLLRDGENGMLVPCGDAEVAADALRRLAEDDELRRAFGRRSRELVASWAYGPSVDAFVQAVELAVASGGAS